MMHRRVVLLVLLFAAACGGGGGGGTSQSAPPPAEPDGPFAAGTTTRTFVDPTRPTAANGDQPMLPSRTLRTSIYYPAVGPPGGRAVFDAAPVSGRRFPLIVFAHGLSAIGPIYFGILEAWAAAGYVVAAPDFPLSNGLTPGGPVGGDYINQPADESFLIDQLLRLNDDPASPLRGLIDPERIGASGQSLGAMTTFGLTLNSCCRDPRVSAAVPMAGALPSFPLGEYDGKLGPPVLIIHGDADLDLSYTASIEAFAVALAPKCLLTHLGGGHILPYVGANDPAAVQATIDSSTAFFDHYLKHERGALDRLLAVGTRDRIRLQCELADR
jgi:dienelactone hydrolase